MNTIKVKDYDSMQAITVSLAKNGYLVTADSVTDEHYKEHWEIKYCELSEITEKSNDFDGDYLGSMEIHNKDNTKGVKCKILPDEKPSVGNEIEVINPHGSLPKHIDPESEPVVFDLDEKPLVENERDILDPIPTKSVQKHKKHIYIPNINKDTSDNITDESMTIVTSVSGN